MIRRLSGWRPVLVFLLLSFFLSGDAATQEASTPASVAAVLGKVELDRGRSFFSSGIGPAENVVIYLEDPAMPAPPPLKGPQFHDVLRERQVTPIQYLGQIGFLGPEVTLGHCVFHSGHSWARYPYVDDLSILADSGASVAHAPYKYAKMGLALESFERYRQRGINIALGTDTFPQDLVSEMRLAALICRVIEQNFVVGKPHDVYDAATLGGARALGRDDLGRLAPGAKADLIVVDLQQMHFGAVRDPIKSLVECASGTDVETIIVVGRRASTRPRSCPSSRSPPSATGGPCPSGAPAARRSTMSPR